MFFIVTKGHNPKMSNIDNEFKIKFGGTLQQVDADTLINSLINTTRAIQEISEDLDPGKKIEVKIKALEPGSFLIHFELMEGLKQAVSLFTKDNLLIANAVIGTLVGAIKIQQHLKGKKPDSVEKNGDKILIENNRGKIVVDQRTYNIFTSNANFSDAIAGNFETLYRDSSITNFEVTDAAANMLVSVPRSDFEEMAVKCEIIDKDKKVKIEVATLHLLKIVFEDKYKWEFYYKGNKISAKINDDEFFNKINQGESFSKGDSIEAKLEIVQVFDFSVNTYVNQSYQIIEVINHTPRGVQQKLDIQ
jgi:hypothetical protein